MPDNRVPKTTGENKVPQLVATPESTFRKYMALDPALPLVLALWTLATHVFDCFDAFPYIAITSPTKRCDKTRLAEIIELLAARGERLVNPTQAVIFRTIQAAYERVGFRRAAVEDSERRSA